MTTSVFMVICLPKNLKNQAIFIITFITTIFIFLFFNTKVYSDTESDFEANLIQLTNEERQKNGLSALHTSQNLTQAARTHNHFLNNCTNSKNTDECFQHTGNGELSLKDRFINAGFTPTSWAENHAWGHKTPKSVFQAWINSSGHKSNILNSDYTSIGCDYFDGNNGDYTKIWWTCDYARGTSTSPITSTSAPTLKPTPKPSPSPTPTPQASPLPKPPTPTPIVKPIPTPIFIHTTPKPWWCRFIPWHPYCK